jgi:hypothetical protein
LRISGTTFIEKCGWGKEESEVELMMEPGEPELGNVTTPIIHFS